jgi:hypothetical protein
VGIEKSARIENTQVVHSTMRWMSMNLSFRGFSVPNRVQVSRLNLHTRRKRPTNICPIRLPRIIERLQGCIPSRTALDVKPVCLNSGTRWPAGVD